MLRDLYIRNLAVLAEASVELGPGLNVLSGETGAGKSIVVDSLALLSGARASSDLIRTGADTLSVVGVFAPAGAGWRGRLEEAGVVVDGEELQVRREVSREGRNRVFVNDQPVTLRLLRELAPELLTIHGQRDELELATPERQRQWLDRAGGAAAEEVLAPVRDRFRRLQELGRRLERLTGDERSRLERIDLLEHQVKEIDAAALERGEEEELRSERGVLRHAEAIKLALGGSFDSLSEDEGAASERLERVRQLLAGVAPWEPQVPAWLELLDGIQIQTEDLASSVGRRFGEVDLDPRRLDAVEDRLALLERLFRRYGSSSTEVLAERDRRARELAELEVDEAGREALEAEVEAERSAYREAALELSRRRREWALDLARRVEAELAELALPKARFAVHLEHRRRDGSSLLVEGTPVDYAEHGVDRVVFEVSVNPGEEMRPLAKVASGGELARIFLALQVVVRGEGAASSSTMVFDEVDAGIGGSQAAAVGAKLRHLAEGGQILSVTHLPQVASAAHRHYGVRKRVQGKRTFVTVEPLGAEHRVEEVARMLAGTEVTELSRSHARELIENEAGS